jgi:hypothetical protein
MGLIRQGLFFLQNLGPDLTLKKNLYTIKPGAGQ